MVNHVYVLYSEKLNKFYIGNTDCSPIERLQQHNNKQHENAFTARGIPWVIFLDFECQSRLQARKIETHIKKMKSKKYVQNLITYPEIIDKLKEKYDV